MDEKLKDGDLVLVRTRQPLPYGNTGHVRGCAIRCPQCGEPFRLLNPTGFPGMAIAAHESALSLLVSTEARDGALSWRHAA
jgi:hypothetical protein